jgi:hypothetical protein
MVNLSELMGKQCICPESVVSKAWFRLIPFPLKNSVEEIAVAVESLGEMMAQL